MAGIYDEELSIHMITLMLAVNRQLPAYHSLQLKHEYTKLPSGGDNPVDKPQAGGVDIPRSTALLVGVGNAGGETAYVHTHSAVCLCIYRPILTDFSCFAGASARRSG